MPSLAGHFFAQKIIMVTDTKKSLTAVLVLISVLLIFIVYYPGLTGHFLLDDWGTLPKLYDDIKIFGFWHGVFDGSTGPTGRPIALLSFALQHEQWGNPYTFKFVNIAIHIVNAVLVGIFTYLLTQNTSIITKNQTALFSVAVAFIWAALPIQTSTVLYIVQRMVLLSTFFTLLAFIGYLVGRRYIITGRLLVGYSTLSLSVGVFGLLALLSKEIGFLTVFYMWVIEQFVNRSNPLRLKSFTLWKVTFFVAPLMAFIVYIAINAKTFFISIYQSRSFSLTERLLTEPRVLWAYVREIILPQASNLSLFHEYYLVSKSLFTPSYTLIAVVAWVSVLAIAYKTRKTLPIFAFTVLWFLIGHSMESSFIPLEIYFDHRNYLPAYGLVFALVYTIFLGDRHIKRKNLRIVFRFVVISYCSLLLSITYKQSELWGKPIEFAMIQASEHPQSLRARSLMVNTLFRLSYLNPKYIDRLTFEIDRLQTDFAGIASIELYDLQFICFHDDIKLVPLDTIEKTIIKAPYELGIIKLVNDVLEYKMENECDRLPFEYLKNLIFLLLKNPVFQGQTESLNIYLADIYLKQKKIDKAIDSLRSIENKSYYTSMHLARLLATNKEFVLALRQLDLAEKLNKRNLNYFNNKKELLRLRNAIQSENSPQN